MDWGAGLVIGARWLAGGSLAAALAPDSKVDSLPNSKLDSLPLDDVAHVNLASQQQQQQQQSKWSPSAAQVVPPSGADAMNFPDQTMMTNSPGVSTAAAAAVSTGAAGAAGAGSEQESECQEGQQDVLLTSPESEMDSMLPEVVLAHNIRLIEALRLDLEVSASNLPSSVVEPSQFNSSHWQISHRIDGWTIKNSDRDIDLSATISFR